jgi:hypothetical protein
MVLRLWSRLLYNEESIACEPCRVGLRPAVLPAHTAQAEPGRSGGFSTGGRKAGRNDRGGSHLAASDLDLKIPISSGAALYVDGA